MAIHTSLEAMLRESLSEMLLVAEYCITFRKDSKKWGSSGCYGYPGAILLLSITDCIGSYVVGGNTKKHFSILNHRDYYDLCLDARSINQIFEAYRNRLTHNAIMEVNVSLSIGDKKGRVLDSTGGAPCLNLLPFLILSKKVVARFLNNAPRIIPQSMPSQEIRQKHQHTNYPKSPLVQQRQVYTSQLTP